MLSVEQAKSEMNKCGSEGTPFLFGFDFELNHAFVVMNPLRQSDILFRTPNAGNVEKKNLLPDSKRHLKICEYISKEEYSNRFRVVKSAINRGDTYLLNLTLKTKIEIDITLKDILEMTTSPYGLLYKDKFVSFSPERFVLIENGNIHSTPMKGTIDAKLENAKETLYNDYKESCEHNTIVDLIRNDVGSVADCVKVSRFKFLEKIKTDRGEIFQMSSEIEGRLGDDYKSSIGDIIFKLLPAGSVSGAPKPSTLNIIERSEGQTRGFYTGVFGYFDGNTLDSAVLIRYIEKDGDSYYYRSGGGITVNSICEDEWEEAKLKIYLPI